MKQPGVSAKPFKRFSLQIQQITSPGKTGTDNNAGVKHKS
jgi:hypothetical protein